MIANMNMDDLRSSYNLIAEDFANEHYNDTWDDDYTQYFITALKDKSKVLDLGCGAGNDTAKLADAGLLAEGIDLSDKLIEIAKKRSPAITFNQGDMLKLPFSHEEFDGVFAKASLLHIAKREMPKVLEEIRRVLKPNGIVHIAIKGGEGEGEISENNYGYEYKRFFSYWKMDDFKPLLEKHGFQVIKDDVFRRTPTSYTIWLKILAKKV